MGKLLGVRQSHRWQEFRKNWQNCQFLQRLDGFEGTNNGRANKFGERRYFRYDNGMKFLGCFFSLLFPFFATAEIKKPNIVFLLVDDLGWGDFGCFGAKFYETPNIDQLAKDGMLFTNAYAACTVCSPSRAAILSGQYPARLHLTDWIAGHVRPNAKLKVPDWTMKLAHERVLLPEALKEAGYNTGFFGKWHLMPNGQPDMKKHFPTAHGFDVNVGGREWGQPKGRGKYFSPFDMPNLDNGKPGDFLTDKLTDAAVDFLDQQSATKPFLLYFSYYTLHSPLMAPEDLVEKYQKKAKEFESDKNEYLDARRAGMVEKLDDSVGRVMEKLVKMGVADNTIVILTGDNGGDHDKTTGGLRDFKGFSHEGGTRVPMIVRWPGKVKTDTRSEEMVIGMDFYPTLLAAVHLEARPDEHRDGLNLLPLWLGQTDKLPRDTLFWHYPHYHRTMPYGAVRQGDWKLIEFFEDGDLELYHLKTDPMETRDLSGDDPDKAREMLGTLRAWRKDVGAQMMTPNPNYKEN